MNSEDFKNWRKQMGFTQAQAAEALGLSKATIENYDKGTRREDGREVAIPLTVALACTALDSQLEPWPPCKYDMTDQLEARLANVYHSPCLIGIYPSGLPVSKILEAFENEFLHSNDVIYRDEIQELKNNWRQYVDHFNALRSTRSQNNEFGFIVVAHELLESIKHN